MAPSVHKKKKKKSRSAFLRGWCSLPTELHLEILSYTLVIREEDPKDSLVSGKDYGADKYSNRPHRFMDVALPFFAVPDLRELAMAAWYGRNTFFFGLSNHSWGENLAYSYQVPHRNTFAYLQHVEIYIRGDYGGWKDLASYCEATKDMPKLNTLKVEFIQLAEIEEGWEVEDALAEIGPLTVFTQKLIVDYHEVGQLFGAIHPPTEQDRADYAKADEVFENIFIKKASDKTLNQKFERHWSNYTRIMEVDETWALPPKSPYPWHKHIVRTQWQ